MKYRRTGFAAGQLVALLATSTLLGCGHHFDPPSREDRIQEADDLYSPAIFDTVAWESDEIRGIEGNIVYATDCRDCHGVMAMGGTRYAVQRDLLVPSLVEPDWEFNGDLEGLRHYIFVGHGTGMPTWGVAGLTLREVDAVTHYLLDVLRPEVLAMGRRCFCGEGDPVRVIQEPREE